MVALRGDGVVRPHDVRNMAFFISMGAMHAPSSCGNATIYRGAQGRRTKTGWVRSRQGNRGRMGSCVSGASGHVRT